MMRLWWILFLLFLAGIAYSSGPKAGPKIGVEAPSDSTGLVPPGAEGLLWYSTQFIYSDSSGTSLVDLKVIRLAADSEARKLTSPPPAWWAYCLAEIAP